MATAISRPESGEYAPYYVQYTSLVQGQDILPVLTAQMKDTRALLDTISEEAGDFRYEPGKWSVREVLGHMIDAERIFAYRALRFSRNEREPLPGFEQDDYVREGPYAHCRMADLTEEFAVVRQATLAMFRNLTPEMWMRSGTASGNPMTVRAAAYIIAGHELHHLAILKERYL